jgi:hypothetical protein
MDTRESSAAHAHPSTEDHDDTVEVHYACLERPCACLGGWVFVGYIDEYGEEREASYACRRCAARACLANLSVLPAKSLLYTVNV